MVSPASTSLYVQFTYMYRYLKYIFFSKNKLMVNIKYNISYMSMFLNLAWTQHKMYEFAVLNLWISVILSIGKSFKSTRFSILNLTTSICCRVSWSVWCWFWLQSCVSCLVLEFLPLWTRTWRTLMSPERTKRPQKRMSITLTPSKMRFVRLIKEILFHSHH